MEDFKIYIFVIQKSFLCSLGEISLVYNLHIEKNVAIVSFRCFVDTFDVLSTKEQLVDESLGEVFLGPSPNFFHLPTLGD